MDRKVHSILTIWTVVILLVFTSVLPVYSQNYIVKTFTTENGLAHNNVRAIAQDSTGFLWIGTWDGLSRFDGYEFKNYYHVPGDSTSLPYFSVYSLFTDGADNLWIFTDDHQVVLYNRENDNFKIVKYFGEDIPVQVRFICLDENKNLWIIGNDKLIRRDFKTSSFEWFDLRDKEGKNFNIDPDFYSIFIGENGKIWLGGKKVYEFKIEGTSETDQYLTFIKSYPLSGSFINRPIRFDHALWFSIYKSEFGNIWLFSNLGLFRLDRKTDIFKEFNAPIPINEFTGRKMFFWDSYTEGLFLYKPLNNSLIHIPESVCNMVKGILTQSDELIWYSSTSPSGTATGLSKLIFTPSYFKDYNLDEKGVITPAIFAIFKDSDNIVWTGVRGANYVTKIIPDGNVNKENIIPKEQIGISGHIRTILKVNGGIWLSYDHEILLFYNYHTGKYIQHFPKSSYFSSLAIDKQGKLYIGGTDLSVYDPVTHQTNLLWKSINTDGIFKLYIDKENNLWGGLNSSKLLKYNISSKIFQVYSLSPDNYNIEDILKDNEGNLWLTFLGGGICRFNPFSGYKKFYTTSSGLPNNTAYSILKDRKENIWISTDNGLSRFDPITERFHNFNKADGLKISEFNSDASFVALDGQLFFGGMGGIVGFYPDSINKFEMSAPLQKILITEFKISGEKRLLANSTCGTDTMVLKKGENNFHISFSSTDFINSEKTMYRYKLDGVSIRWTETDSHNRNINYSNLKPGRYLLQIQATNRDDKWTADKKIVFSIPPYFYQTRLFLISVPLFLIILVAAILTLYISKLKQRERQKQDALKLQSLRGQMNPHFIFNSLNSINYFISNNDKLSANRYIADFSRLIRSILSNLDNDYVPLENELNSIKDYLNIEHLRFGDKFDFELNTDKVHDTAGMEVFPGLVQPFIENAIWHGVRALEKRKGLIKIQFSSYAHGKIKCTIEDDGIGRQAAIELRDENTNHKPRGIGIVIERLELISKLRGINFNLEITDLYPDMKETGTRVEIDIPIKSSKQI